MDTVRPLPAVRLYSGGPGLRWTRSSRLDSWKVWRKFVFRWSNKTHRSMALSFSVQHPILWNTSCDFRSHLASIVPSFDDWYIRGRFLKILVKVLFMIFYQIILGKAVLAVPCCVDVFDRFRHTSKSRCVPSDQWICLRRDNLFQRFIVKQNPPAVCVMWVTNLKQAWCNHKTNKCIFRTVIVPNIAFSLLALMRIFRHENPETDMELVVVSSKN